ncbi:hypothetical protein ACFRCQ_26060 [Cytobacillus firmus]|uniref:hypothetical protein n=1 Tax=Cytobacillus firmus TaxID=1399 RepID=UPI0036BDAC5C
MNKEIDIKFNINVEKLIELNSFHSRYGLKVVSYVYDEWDDELEGVIVEERDSLDTTPNIYLLKDIQYTNILNGFYCYDLKEAKRLLNAGCTFSLSKIIESGFYRFTFIRSINDIFTLICSEEERDYLLNSVINFKR